MTTAIDPKERPILMSAPMVGATLRGSKWHTRRTSGLEAINAAPDDWTPIVAGPFLGRFAAIFERAGGERVSVFCPYGEAGDQLWVREMMREDATGVWRYAADNEVVGCSNRADETAMVTWAHHNERAYCPSIHMPRWACRLLLQIAVVRVERLQTITPEDAMAEGVTTPLLTDSYKTPREGFAQLWDQINGKRGYSWEHNPWVWVIEFKRVEQ